jgi:CMP-N,N'-diacetyllegionaminic acid synthase
MRALVIGFGSIGRRHCEVLRAGFAGAEIHAVSRQTDIGLTVFPDLGAVPDPASYDYFVIASETHLHHGHLAAIRAAVSGKTILVEKPVFDRPLEPPAEGNRVFVAYQIRFHPVIQAARRELAGSRIHCISASVGQYLPTWRPDRDYRLGYSASSARGGGVLLDLSHEIDYVQFLAGPIARASGLAGKFSDLEIDSDDVAAGIGVTASGAAVQFSMDYLSRIPFRRLVVHAEGRTLMGDLIANTLEVRADGGEARSFSFGPQDRNAAYLAMHRAALAGGGDCCTLREGLQVLATAERIRETGRNLV